MKQHKNHGSQIRGSGGIQLWQHDLHPVWLRRTDIIQQKLRYIHRNPVEEGLVEEPHHYLYSSARDEAGLPGMLKLASIWGAGDHRSPWNMGNG